MVTKREAPESVCRDLCEAVDRMDRQFPGENSPAVGRALAAYRAATAPLRTRAEVDAEIAATVRAAYRIPAGALDSLRLNVLCSEPTAEETEVETLDARHERMNAAGFAKIGEIIGRKTREEWSAKHEPTAEEP